MSDRETSDSETTQATDERNEDTDSLSDAGESSSDQELSSNAETGEGSKGNRSLTPFLEGVRAPISDEVPTGERILYDEDFRALKTNIDAIGSASGEADYEHIVELARTILLEKSKDLRVGSYLVLGEARLRGAQGAQEGFQALRLLIEEYWESLYPEKSRMRGRGNAIQFIEDRLPDWLGDASFGSEDRPFLVSILGDLEEIQEFSLQKMGEHAPALSGLKKDIEGAISDLPDPEPDPEPEPASTSETVEEKNRSTSTTESSNLASERGPSETGSESEATQAIHSAIQFYQKEDRSHPVSYRLLRTIRWGHLRQVPPNENGTTRFEAPRSQRRDYLEGLLEEENYETLVQEGESSLQGGTFHVWLDLQRLVAAAVKALGPTYEEVHQTILLELAILLRRVPALTSLSFKDGTPFASPLTVDWVETQVEPQLSADDEEREQTASTSGSTSVLTEQYQEARKELTRGSLENALSIMQEGRASNASKKDKFNRQFYVANLCVKGEKPKVARPLLDQLSDLIQQHLLDVWDPSLAIEVWTLRCQCYDQLAENAPKDEVESLYAEAEKAFENICRTDPSQALSLGEYGFS